MKFRRQKEVKITNKKYFVVKSMVFDEKTFQILNYTNFFI